MTKAFLYSSFFLFRKRYFRDNTKRINVRRLVMRIYSNIREIIVSLICIAMFTLSSVFASDRVVTYPIPEGIEMNPDFTVEVSADGKIGRLLLLIR